MNEPSTVNSGLVTDVSRPLRRRLTPYLLLLPGLAWLAVFFLYPMVTLAQTSLEQGTIEQGFEFTWSLSNYWDALDQFREQYLRSFQFAALTTVLALVIGYPLAYFIAFRAGRWKNVMLLLVIMPFLTSFLVRTLAWRLILADNGTVVNVLQTVGIVADDGRVLATGRAVIAGLTYNFLPFMILPLYVSLEKIDRRLIEAAHDLYASSFTAFRKVTFRLSLPGVVAGTLLTFIPAAGDFVNSRFLGTPAQFMIGNVIESRFLVLTDFPTAAALSMTLMLTILVLVLLYLRRFSTEEIL